MPNFWDVYQTQFKSKAITLNMTGFCDWQNLFIITTNNGIWGLSICWEGIIMRVVGFWRPVSVNPKSKLPLFGCMEAWRWVSRNSCDSSPFLEENSSCHRHLLPSEILLICFLTPFSLPDDDDDENVSQLEILF